MSLKNTAIWGSLLGKRSQWVDNIEGRFFQVLAFSQGIYLFSTTMSNGDLFKLFVKQEVAFFFRKMALFEFEIIFTYIEMLVFSFS